MKARIDKDRYESFDLSLSLSGFNIRFDSTYNLQQSRYCNRGSILKMDRIELDEYRWPVISNNKPITTSTKFRFDIQ